MSGVSSYFFWWSGKEYWIITVWLGWGGKTAPNPGCAWSHATLYKARADASLYLHSARLLQVAANGDLANWIIPGKMVKVPMADGCLKMVLYILYTGSTIMSWSSCHYPNQVVDFIIPSTHPHWTSPSQIATWSSLMRIMTRLEVVLQFSETTCVFFLSWNDSRTKVSGNEWYRLLV